MLRRFFRILLLAWLAVIAGAAAIPAYAQVRGPVVPPPMVPATGARNYAGSATIRAVRIQSPIELDGRLDEEVYAATPQIDCFIQQEPSEGAATSEATH